MVGRGSFAFAGFCGHPVELAELSCRHSTLVPAFVGERWVSAQPCCGGGGVGKSRKREDRVEEDLSCSHHGQVETREDEGEEKRRQTGQGPVVWAAALDHGSWVYGFIGGFTGIAMVDWTRESESERPGGGGRPPHHASRTTHHIAWLSRVRARLIVRCDEPRGRNGP